jgi:hypothetical protein
MAIITVTTLDDLDFSDDVTSLREAIALANADPSTADVITFDASLAGGTIVLESYLPLLDGDMTIDGGANGITISGSGQHRIFFANAGEITIASLTLADGYARGGNGGSAAAPGGGGMGAGGALFVRGSLDGHAAPAVTLDNVQILNNAATGGDAGGQVSDGLTASAGGGGLGGDGGSAPNATDNAGQGGGGAFPGETGQSSAGGTGGTGGGADGGAGGGVQGGAGGAFSGGGGGGNGGTTGGAGGLGGGGGGGGTGITPPGIGGDGGFGGGGGGATYFGGNGGYGGGGGLAGGANGEGGFGGGNDSAESHSAGGGAGMGGGIFVMAGATLTIVGAAGLSGGSVQGGSGSNSAQGGHAFGAGLFLHGSGTLAFAPDAGVTQTITDGIDDEAGVVAAGYIPSAGFTPGSWILTKAGAGTLILDGDNAHGGPTAVNAGTLLVNGATRNSLTTVNAGGTLGGNGVTGAVNVVAGGTLAAGASPGILGTGSLALAAGAFFEAEIGGITPGADGYDEVKVTGSVDLGGADLDVVLLGGFVPGTGNAFMILDNDGSDAIEGAFAGLAEGDDFEAAGAWFSISYQGGDGNDVVLTAVAAPPPPPPAVGVTIIGTAGANVVNETTTVPGQPYPTQFDDVIRGLAGSDILFGLGGADLIEGGRGRDYLRGGDGDDALKGDRGADVLNGGPGDDLLTGGKGRDVLTGGEGSDGFVFVDRTHRDRITDFEDGDLIYLAQSAFPRIGPAGMLKEARFHVGAEAETKKQRIVYDEDKGLLLYAKHGSATTDPVKFAKIGAGLDLDHTDFLVT